MFKRPPDTAAFFFDLALLTFPDKR
jgi:hypothetical protein